MKLCCSHQSTLTGRSCSLAAEHRGPHEYLPTWPDTPDYHISSAERRVVEAAIAWKHAYQSAVNDTYGELMDAIDALEKASRR